MSGGSTDSIVSIENWRYYVNDLTQYARTFIDEPIDLPLVPHNTTTHNLCNKFFNEKGRQTSIDNIIISLYKILFYIYHNKIITNILTDKLTDTLEIFDPHVEYMLSPDFLLLPQFILLSEQSNNISVLYKNLNYIKTMLFYIPNIYKNNRDIKNYTEQIDQINNQIQEITEKIGEEQQRIAPQKKTFEQTKMRIEQRINEFSQKKTNANAQIHQKKKLNIPLINPMINLLYVDSNLEKLNNEIIQLDINLNELNTELTELDYELTNLNTNLNKLISELERNSTIEKDVTAKLKLIPPLKETIDVVDSNTKKINIMTEDELNNIKTQIGTWHDYNYQLEIQNLQTNIDYIIKYIIKNKTISHTLSSTITCHDYNLIYACKCFILCGEYHLLLYNIDDKIFKLRDKILYMSQWKGSDKTNETQQLNILINVRDIVVSVYNKLTEKGLDYKYLKTQIQSRTRIRMIPPNTMMDYNTQLTPLRGAHNRAQDEFYDGIKNEKTKQLQAYALKEIDEYTQIENQYKKMRDMLSNHKASQKELIALQNKYE